MFSVNIKVEISHKDSNLVLKAGVRAATLTPASIVLFAKTIAEWLIGPTM